MTILGQDWSCDERSEYADGRQNAFAKHGMTIPGAEWSCSQHHHDQFWHKLVMPRWKNSESKNEICLPQSRHDQSRPRLVMRQSAKVLCRPSECFILSKHTLSWPRMVMLPSRYDQSWPRLVMHRFDKGKSPFGTFFICSLSFPKRILSNILCVESLIFWQK